MNRTIERWKVATSKWKYLIIWLIAILLFLELFRIFIHNLTTRVGWWMFFMGVLFSTIIYSILLLTHYEWISEMYDFFHTLGNKIYEFFEFLR